MPYIYDNEDNQPMNEESIQAPDRDCPNCRYKLANGQCSQWDCHFVPKDYVIREVEAWQAMERIRRELPEQ